MSAVRRCSSSRPRGSLRCVERCCPSAAQARRSETCSCARTCSMQARRRAGLRSFPAQPPAEWAYPASDRKPPCATGCSRAQGPSGASPARSSAHRTPGASDNTSPRSRRSGGLRPPCSGPARPEHLSAATWRRSLQACIASLPLQSSLMSQTYLKSDHFNGGGSVSPTHRCGKTSTMIVLQYLTPRSEISNNITGPALFRYIEQAHPTLLIDEADSFVRDNEELRGILNSGHTKASAYVRRTVEVNGEHTTRRFSTWTPKAVATIRGLAVTLEDRAVTLMLQRKPPGKKVERLRRRDNKEFADLRSQAKRWAADNFDKLTDPDPETPEQLNDRAADNWRPLLAIAELAGGEWPKLAREAACLLSGEAHTDAMGIELLKDIRAAFGADQEIRSADLIAKLTADPERPWAEWKHGRPLSQKQLGSLLKPFCIISTTVHRPGLAHGKGYRRADFTEAWDAYCPDQNTPLPQSGTSEACKRASADEMGITHD